MTNRFKAGEARSFWSRDHGVQRHCDLVVVRVNRRTATLLVLSNGLLNRSMFPEPGGLVELEHSQWADVLERVG